MDIGVSSEVIFAPSQVHKHGTSGCGVNMLFAYPRVLSAVKDISCAMLEWWGKVISRQVFEVNKTRLDKEVGSSILNGRPESLQDDADTMKECFVSTSYFSDNGFIDEKCVAHV
ncbi:hypothetical protein G6F37_010861 [Rhizopus arrhizus]|nr:hypothetical protein G6F38_010931 [Rhizopus arrhizus]KAG1152096.1 hypothetical protein G6F37_010861 [Rhizopus arrhizus]